MLVWKLFNADIVLNRPNFYKANNAIDITSPKFYFAKIWNK